MLYSLQNRKIRQKKKKKVSNVYDTLGVSPPDDSIK